MRETQIFGLSEAALAFLNENGKRVPILCPTCQNGTLPNQLLKQEWGSAASEGMFDDGPPLYEYKLNDGCIVREVVQAVPWSSGPCIFLCLEINGERRFEWPEDQIRTV